MNIEKFTLTEQHVKLLRRMYVSWDDAEFGAPAIDPKRPYGNSDVEVDMSGILDMGFEGEDDDGEKVLSDDQCAALRRLHSETQTALQIVLATGSFEPGEYEKEQYIGDWQRAV